MSAENIGTIPELYQAVSLNDKSAISLHKNLVAVLIPLIFLVVKHKTVGHTRCVAIAYGNLAEIGCVFIIFRGGVLAVNI